jgi:cyclic beta-1,2-glucan synthetase
MTPAPKSSLFEAVLRLAPTARFLSNQSYTVQIGPSGHGHSWAGSIHLDRFDADRLGCDSGLLIQIRDLGSGRSWRVGEGHRSDSGFGEPQARWQPGLYEIEQQVDELSATLSVCVVEDHDVELRRLRLANRSSRECTLQVTTYAEVVLSDPGSFEAHPAFSKLFLQTELIEDSTALVVRRRPRSQTENWPWLLHAMRSVAIVGWETDRGRYLGRRSSAASADALQPESRLLGTVGNVLDPCVSLRGELTLAPGESAELLCLLGVGQDREAATGLIRAFDDDQVVESVFAAARAAAQERLKELGITVERAERYQALAAAMIYGQPVLRASPEILGRAGGDLALLGRYGLSPSRPFAIVHAHGEGAGNRRDEFELVQRYWQRMGLELDLILAEESNSVTSPSVPEAEFLDATASLVVTGGTPAFDEANRSSTRIEAAASERTTIDETSFGGSASGPPHLESEKLALFNGLGGFSPDGSEYVIRLVRQPDGSLRHPPRAWGNVFANQRFGSLVSESGAGCTWYENSRLNRLTPWSNDSLVDPHSEAFYIRDEESGSFWSPLPGPCPGPADYEVRHGFGMSRFRTQCGGLEQETVLFVAAEDPVRMTQLRLVNRSSRTRHLSLFAYYRLVLGDSVGNSGRFVQTAVGPVDGSLLARNRMSADFAEQAVFASLAATRTPHSIRRSADRAAFIGPGHDVSGPAALLGRRPLPEEVGPGLDACFAQQVVVDLEPGEDIEVCFLLGAGANEGEAESLISRYSTFASTADARQEVARFWGRLLSTVRVETPSLSLDLMLNGWLLYQTLSCRMWGRSAAYQSSGALGFRDQLQDSGAFLHVRPALTRSQILNHGRHQFEEGDVLHWWHPPTDAGIRTHFADDLLWLPLLTTEYVRATGDREVLEEQLAFVHASALEPGEDEVFVRPQPSPQSASLYEHCCRAIDRSFGRGAHGLPLFGTGDWNDGMNRVGRQRRGESVWMGFFLHKILGDFAPLCEERGDHRRAERYSGEREALRVALNEGGWDGAWYRRGYYDDGSPLGSSHCDECKIDALAQSWSVLSSAAPPDRANEAMEAVEQYLISDEERIIRLLTPPFADTPHDPGYIKGYVSGVRENGGQYTHAALWVVRAMAALGRNERTMELLDLLNPIRHAETPEQVATYQVEPYVVAADVYGASPHIGRGGWTWYTGSSGWMYRVALESLLGFEIVGGKTIQLKPCVPEAWPRFTIEYSPEDGVGTRYRIEVHNPGGTGRAVIMGTLDGRSLPVDEGGCGIPLQADGALHRVSIELGRREGESLEIRA